MAIAAAKAAQAFNSRLFDRTILLVFICSMLVPLLVDWANRGLSADHSSMPTPSLLGFTDLNGIDGPNVRQCRLSDIFGHALAEKACPTHRRDATGERVGNPANYPSRWGDDPYCRIGKPGIDGQARAQQAATSARLRIWNETLQIDLDAMAVVAV
tara:strand:+ start:62003 stop:62470 length:468 start_codon:yes stop_codon:yes gene_type:complete